MVYAAAEPEVEGVVYTEDEIEGILSMCGLPPENFAVEGCIPEMYRQPGDEEEEHVFELVKQINQVIIAPAVKDEVFRMPIMQSFNVKNIATVAIGRVTQGTLQVGDHVEIVGFEKRMPARVVRLDMASKSVDEIMAGDNASVALAGVSATEVQKGQMVTAPGTTEMTDVLRAMVYVRKESNDARGLLRNKSRLTLSTDCLDATALVLMEGKDYCIGGDYAPIEIRLIQEIPYVHGMRFWLRDEKDVIAEGSVI